MTESAFPMVDAREILSVVGGASFTRGKVLATDAAMSDFQWDPVDQILSGTVAEDGEENRPVRITLGMKKEERIIAEGECSCGDAPKCKHVAAVLIYSNSMYLRAKDVLYRDTAAAVPVWQQTLQELLAPAPAAAKSLGGPNSKHPVLPMGLQFELQDTTLSAHQQWAPGSGVGQLKVASRRWRLAVRPMVHSGGDRWVRGNLRWNNISFKTYGLNLDNEQHRWFCQFVPLYRAKGELYFGEDNDWLYLDEYSSSLLWDLFTEAKRLGIKLIGVRPNTQILIGSPAQVALGAQISESGLALAPTLSLAGHDFVLDSHSAAGSIGNHGVYAANEEHTQIFLGQVPAGLSHTELTLLQHPEELNVPLAERDEFFSRVYPRLARKLRVTSPDASVELPAVLPPKLVAKIRYGARDSVDMDWTYDYHGLAVDAIDRDRETESALEHAALDVLNVFPGFEAAVLGPRHLQGLEVIDFVRRVLPELMEIEGLVISESGIRPEFHELTEAPELIITTVESDRRDWFDLGLLISIGDRQIPFADILRALSKGETKLLMPDRSYFSLSDPLFDKLRELVSEAGGLRDMKDKEADISLTQYQFSLWEELEDLASHVEGPDAWISALNSLVNLKTTEVADLPPTLNATLRPYQVEGFGWLATLWRNGLGGVLADDMGLGKTLQALALILHAHQVWADPEAFGAPNPHIGKRAPFLVVAPTSVVSNWKEEAARFAPSLRVIAVTDTESRATSSLATLAKDYDIVVTSYTLLRLDDDAYADIPWAGLILDEAQFVKNKATKAHHVARDMPARFKLAITGTPMENNLMELWSIFAIVSPGLFPSSVRFAENYQRPIERQGLPEPLTRLRRRVRPFMLRRTKDAVVTDLPPKQEQVLQVELGPEHRKVYDTHLQRERQKVLRLVDDMDKNRFTIFQSLTLLRMLALDASLVDPEYAHVSSAKLDVLFEQLEDVLAEGHRALIFSQFTSFLKKAADRLDAAGVPYAYLDGSTRKRAEVINSFKSGEAPVFLISLKAGGFGLNLTEADYCFLLDPWWNPAAESQAVDRAHRIGQTRNVMVYRMVAKNTIEEKVVALQDSKRQLISSVMDEGAGFGKVLNADDIRELLR
ncbi:MULTISPECIES: DEAD/DEAH box helicase [Paeniglutamicibacter]|jgi:SNF2 family DNA or RNA helicase|uniref:DEAD/DEAH box helicase n=1 Tax=Paeniglutamicibacter terrestris TaxID=2723403 RepID=A0ABX1G846_9MICC|nr:MULTISPECIES: DEAD/DEAH box helicase [Paeniglutamicibacter]NKG21602.1 DEAD/DEAH box helicase [Paeniglutamicibacter terrestris]QXQ10846.1 DEAD/DEAH box helicase [Paeniglutamicibacter sp. Y32M11]